MILNFSNLMLFFYYLINEFNDLIQR